MLIRLATRDDIPAIESLQQDSIEKLQIGYLTPEQIEASKAGMGLDTQLIDDGTYFCVVEDDTLIGCGGWSFRKTLYGGNHSQGRDAAELDPETDRARIRAMYTHPDHTGRGVGRLVIEEAEKAAREKGFIALEMAATMAGVPFYLKCGYTIEREWEDTNGAVPVPLRTMVKTI